MVRPLNVTAARASVVCLSLASGLASDCDNLVQLWPAVIPCILLTLSAKVGCTIAASQSRH